MPYLPRWLVVKNLPASAGDTGSIPGLGRSPGVGIGNPLQYSCLEDPMGRGAWRATAPRVAKSRTQLSTHAWLGPLSGWRSSFLFLVYLRFCHERVLDFVRCLFCVYWDDHMVPFTFFLEYCVLVDYFDVKSILHSWDESRSVAVSYPSICCWLSIARILLRMSSSLFLPGLTLCICWWVWCCPTGLWSSVSFSLFFFFFCSLCHFSRHTFELANCFSWQIKYAVETL